MCFPLASTKTTGAGWRVEIIFAYVSRKASLRHGDWLEVGWKLMEQWPGTLLGTTFCRSSRLTFVVSAEGPPATTTPST